MPVNSVPPVTPRVLLPQRADPALRAAIEAVGAVVEELQLVERVPVPSEALDALPGRVGDGEVDWLAITSPFTVVALEQLGHPLAGLVTPRLRLAAVGPASARAVQRSAGRVDLWPTLGTGGAALAATFPDGSGRVVVPGAAVSSQDLARGLGARGWTVEQVAVYATRPAAGVPADVARRWRSGGYDALIVTSASVADAAAALLGTAGRVVAVGEPSAAAASRAGFVQVGVAASAAAADVARTVAELLN